MMVPVHFLNVKNVIQIIMYKDLIVLKEFNQNLYNFVNKKIQDKINV